MKKHYKTIDEVGLTLNQQCYRWTVCSEELVQHSGRKQVHVQCVCGTYAKIRHERLKNGTSQGCKHCSGKINNYPETRKSRALHYKKLRHTYLSRLKHNSNLNRGNKVIHCDLTIEDLYNQLVLQDYKCALTGTFLNVIDTSFGDSNGSVDRIDSNQGYTKDNIQWVTKEANLMKNKFNQNRFIEICKMVANKHDNFEPS